MAWAAVSAAGVGVVGGMLANKGGSQTASSDPWGPQQQYLQHGFGQAKDALQQAQDMGPYTGAFTAGLNPYQSQGYNTVANFAQNQGLPSAQNMVGVGNGMLGLGSQFGANAGAIFNKASQDPTQQVISNAGQYASNPYLDSQITAATRDVSRNLNEQQLPALDMAAAGSGNMNSSRTGVAEALMKRGADDRVADISANMRGNAYQSGLGMAQQQYNAGMSQMMGANGQLLQGGQFGADALGNGINMGYGAGDAMARAGAGFQQQAQSEINGARDQHQYLQNNNLDLLGKYMGIINGNYGGNTTTTTSGNQMAGAMAGAMGGLGLYGQFKGMQSPAAPPAPYLNGGSYNPDN